MHSKTLLRLALASACAAVLAGCAGMDFDRKREQSVTEIDTNLYLYKAYLPYETRPYNAKDYVADLATRHCNQMGRGSQPVEASTKFSKGGGIEVQYVFRCVQYLPTPEQPFVDHNSSVS